MSHKVKVLFVGGYGRSGSTLLDRLLGQVDGVFSVGELRHIWSRSFGEDQLCGCGVPFSRCDFWSRVVRDALGGFEAVDVAGIKRLKAKVDRARFIPFLGIRRPMSARFDQRLSEYAGLLGRLYRGIQTASGCELIVDSTKDPSYGFVLSRVDEVDLSVVHLVRDSRAVAYSWKRKKVRPEIHWTEEYMPRYSITKSAAEWTALNFLTSQLKRVTKYRLIRYEDLVDDPQGTIAELLMFAGHHAPPASGVGGGESIEFGANHTVSGNPIRFKRGPITIAADTEWRNNLGAREYALTTALTWPLLATYGYSMIQR